ncbi:hypothetical protein H1C71_039266, partial [Ictidomys tridecemlineatus]
PPWSPEVDVEPTPARPVQHDPGLTLTGGSAIGLVVAASVSGATLLGIAVFFCMKNLWYRCPFPVHWARPLGPHHRQSWLCTKTDLNSRVWRCPPWIPVTREGG